MLLHLPGGRIRRVRALGEQLQKRERFFHDIQRSAGLLEFHLRLRQPLPQPLILRLCGRAAFTPCRRNSSCGNGSGRGRQRPGITRLAPVADMRVIQALAAQQRSFRARPGSRVVLLDYRQLVRGGEGTPSRLGRPRAVRPAARRPAGVSCRSELVMVTVC